MTTEMNVWRFYPPGGVEKLRHERCPIPDPIEHGQVLIKVYAASVIAPELDWPIYQQEDGSYVSHIPCHDFSGTVASLGPGCEDFEIEVGSEVYAFTAEFNSGVLRKYEGAAAEYALAHRSYVALKPKNLSLLDAASVPLSALTAWQALYDHAQLQNGQKVTITGAAGPTGLWAVQIARLIGAHVIGTASSARSFELLEELGVDQIIDYKKQKVGDVVQSVDVVLDAVGGQAVQCAKVMKPDGIIVSLVDDNVEEQVKERKAKFFIVEENQDQLQAITKLIESGKLKTYVDSVFPFDKAPEAFKYGAQGRAHGKVLLQVSS